MSKVDALRKLIREELRVVLREELPRILNENRKPAGSMSYKDSILESQNKSRKPVPGTLNAERKPVVPKFSNTNPLASFLNDTAVSMVGSQDEMYMSPVNQEVDGFSVMQNASINENVATSDVNGMLASARPSSAVEMVQINEVPDFTDLMTKMRAKGVM
jgi:hypothetical protein